MPKLRSILRRGLVAASAALLLGTTTAPVAAREVHAEQALYQHIWYFESTRTTVVGEAEVYCDGTYRRLWGARTNYPLIATYDCF